MLPKGYKTVVDWFLEVAEKDEEGGEGYSNEVIEMVEEDDSEDGDEGGANAWNINKGGVEGEKFDSGKPAWEVEGDDEGEVKFEGEKKEEDVILTS